MPTFFTDDPSDGNKSRRVPLITPHTGPGFDYRPRRREGMHRRDQNEGFAPPAIPPDVKEKISARINDMMRKSRGPDETMFVVNEIAGKLSRFASALLQRLPGRRVRGEGDEGDDEADDFEAFGHRDDGDPSGDDEERRGGQHHDKPCQGRGEPRQGEGPQGGKRRGRRGGRGKKPQDGKAQQNPRPQQAQGPQSGGPNGARPPAAKAPDPAPNAQEGGRNRRRRGRRGGRKGGGE